MNVNTKKHGSRKKAHILHEVEAGVGGALAGAAMGAVGGPAGAVAGAVMGGVVGALADLALERQADDAEIHDAELDEDIGVAGGDMGAPSLKHPPAKSGAPSAASAGLAAAGANPAEGPIQGVD